MKDIKKKLIQIQIFIIFLVVVYIFISPPIFPTSETADVRVMVTDIDVSDELFIWYDTPIDKTCEAKPGWKFITLDLWVNNFANEIREYSNGWIETKEGASFRLYFVENQNNISLAEGTNSYSILPVELKPDEGIITKVVVQVPLNEDIDRLYLTYSVNGDDLKYSEFGRVKMTLWYHYILAYIYG